MIRKDIKEGDKVRGFSPKLKQFFVGVVTDTDDDTALGIRIHTSCGMHWLWITNDTVQKIT